MSKIHRLVALATLLLLTACGEAPSTEALIEEARRYMEQGEYAAAEIELKNALAASRQSGEARWLLGKVHLQRGDFAAAAKELDHAARIGWNTDQVYPALAMTLLQQQRYVHLRELDTSTLGDLARARVFAAQALAEEAQGEKGPADLLMQSALELAPQSAEVQLASANLRTSRGDLDGALVQLKSLLQATPDHAAGHLLMGDVQLSLGDFDAAHAAYSKVIELEPEHYTAHLKLAQLLLQQRQIDAAAASAETLAQLAPQAAGTLYIQGLVEFYRQDYPEAIATLSRIEPAFRELPHTLFYLGYAHLAQGNVERAIELIERFVAISPDNVAGRKLLATLSIKHGEPEDALELLQPVLAQHPEDTGALNLSANALMRLGRTDEGIELLARIASLRPDSAEAQVRLGAGMLMAGSPDDAAIAHIESALALDPGYQQADLLLVLNQLQRGDNDAALEAARDFAARNPDRVTPYNLLARVHLAREDEEQARQALTRALEIDPADPGANHALAQLALQAGDHAAARQYYRAVLAQYPELLSTLLLQARLDIIESNTEAAESTLQRAIRAHGQALQPRTLLAELYLRQGRASEVSALFQDLQPASAAAPAALRLKAISYLELQQFENAREQLKKLLQRVPDNAAVHLMMARAAAGGGDIAGARSALQHALQLEPGQFPAQLALTRLELAADDREAFARELETLVAQAPDNPDVLELRARAAWQTGDLEQAVAFTERAFRVDPREPRLLQLSAYLGASEQYPRSITLHQDWLKDHQDSIDVRLSLAITQGQAGHRADAIAQYRQLLQQAPEHPVVLNNLAWELREEQPQQALQYARRAVALQPDNAASLDTLAVLEYLHEDYRAARRSIEKALQQAPEQPSMIYHRAMIEAASGRSDEARETLEALLERTSAFPELEEAQALLQQVR